MNKLTYILSVLRSPRKIVRSLSYIINDEVYWDAYVRDWLRSGQGAELTYLGNEWKNEELFLSLLEKYSTTNGMALEIGCGGGRITSKAAKLFRHVQAADVSSEMLRQCQRSLPYKNVSYHKIDGFTLNGFPDSSVGFVFSHDVFVHFSSLQVYPYLEEIRRVLKQGGIGLVSFYGFQNSFELFKKMALRHRDERRFPPHMRVHFVTEEMIRLMLSDLGFEVLGFDNTNFLIAAFRK